MDATIQVVVVLTAIISVMVSLITAVSSTKRDAFLQLERVVDQLRRDLQEEKKRSDEMERRGDALEAELAKVNRWSRKLMKQLIEHDIEPVSIDDTLEKIKAIRRTDD